MAENRALLSQSEIDALVSFLQKDKATEKASIGDVLDQSSIDRLVDLIRSNNDQGVFLDPDAANLVTGEGEVAIIAPDGSVVDKSSCELDYKITPEGIAEIYCVNMSDASFYKIGPDCLLQGKYVNSSSEWGRAISPRHFVMTAEMFGLEYSPEAFNSVVARFAEIMYGASSAKPAEIYYPVKK